MGGPRVTENAKRLIIDIWTNLSKSGKEPTSKQVLAAAESYIKRSNRKDIFLPKLRKVQLIITEARKHRGELSSADKAMQEPWNLSTLDKHPISSESIPYVLQVWRYSVSLGTEFTIRQAKWASRLYSQVSDITELWFASRRYSREEELALSTNTQMRIFLLDSSLVMGDWERSTSMLTDILKYPIFYIRHTFIPYGNDGGIAEELINALPLESFEYIKDEKQACRAYEISRGIEDLSSSTRYFQDLETRMVYLRHLSYISNLPKWNELYPKEIIDIVVELRNWVNEASNKIRKADIEDKIPNTSRILPESLFALESYPEHLYIRAGYKQGGQL